MSIRTLVTCTLLFSGQIAQADTIRLKSGDELNAVIVEVTADTVIIEHPELGRMKIPRAKIEGDLKHKLNPGLFGTQFMRGWDRRIDLGFNGSQGNSISRNVTGGLNLNYKDEEKYWIITGRYFFQGDENGTSDNNARLDIRREWLLPGSRWFAYSALRYQYDEFEPWLHRIVLTAGPGYNLVKREKNILNIRFGPAYTRDFDGLRKNQAEALLAMDYTWKPRDRLKLTLSNMFYAQLAPDAGQWRNVTLAEWSMRLFNEPELDFILGGENEYETDIEPPDKKLRLKYYMTLGLNF